MKVLVRVAIVLVVILVLGLVVNVLCELNQSEQECLFNGGSQQACAEYTRF